MQRKLGKPTDQRMALLKNQVSNFLWYGRLETTYARAKEIQKLAEKYITMAIDTFEDTVQVEKTKTINNTTSTVTVINDGVKKLAVRREFMANLNDLQEVKKEDESEKDFNLRVGDIKHPLVEKIFNEYAPRYKQRKEQTGQGGGYTRIYKLGPRKGDAAEVAIIELI